MQMAVAVLPRMGNLGPYTYQFTGVPTDNTGGALTTAISNIPNGTTNGFCVDLVDDIGQSGYTANVYSLANPSTVSLSALQHLGQGQNVSAAVTELQQLAGEYVKAAGSTALVNPQASTLSYALQYAIWEIVTASPPAGNSSFNLGSSYLLGDSLGDSPTTTALAPGLTNNPVEIANYWLESANL